MEQAAQRGTGLPLADRLGALIDVAIDHQFGSAMLAAVLDHEERRLPIDDVLFATQVRIVKVIQAVFDQQAELSGVALPPSAAWDCLTMAKALIEAEAGRAEPDLQQLRQRVLRAIRGFLLESGQAPQRQPGAG